MTCLALFAAAKAELGSDKFASQLTSPWVSKESCKYTHMANVFFVFHLVTYSIGLRKVIVYFINTSALSQGYP